MLRPRHVNDSRANMEISLIINQLPLKCMLIDKCMQVAAYVSAIFAARTIDGNCSFDKINGNRHHQFTRRDKPTVVALLYLPSIGKCIVGTSRMRFESDVFGIPTAYRDKQTSIMMEKTRERNRYEFKCAELAAITAALYHHVDLRDAICVAATIRSIRSKIPSTIAAPCNVCASILREYDIDVA